MLNTFFEDASLLVYIAFHIYLFSVLIFIIMENRDAQSTFSWIMVFILLPVIGLLIYIFFGRNWRIHSEKKKIFNEKIAKELSTILEPIRKKEKSLIEELKNCSMADNKRLIDLLDNFDESIFTHCNNIKILQNGSEKFPALETDLKNAQKYIHMEYFIWRDDKLTNRIKDILIDRVKAGVEVRIMFDPAGSILLLMKGRKYLKELRDAGIEIVPFFNSMTRSKITTLNNINHHKIVVIDGQIAYTGGMNMGQEYIDGKPMYDSWRDTSIRIEGEAVIALQSLFVFGWKAITGTSLFDKKYFTIPKPITQHLPIQILASGPDSKESTIKQLFFSMITAANEKVFIQSPYFVPDATIFEALKLSALSGVDTRVMVTGVPDKKVAYWAAYSFFEELLEAGVKIYHYNAGFIHSKTISVDEKFCTIGTTNLDLRSFNTSHEVNAVIYDADTTKELEQDFINDMKVCTELTLKEYEGMSKFTKFRNSLSRLLAPLL